MLLSILTIMFLNFGCKTNHDYLPDKKKVLTPDFSNYENFFPIATLDLAHKGIQDKIHIMYVSFDPSIDHRKPFPGADYIDEFSFNITNEGLFKPTFDKSALIIGNDFRKYFVEGQAKYNKAMQTNQASTLINFSDEPGWWQDDQTPMNSKGKPMTFICQLDIYEVFNDDSRLFVFYDKDDRAVKYIYQRD
jgi:hypothetical protein